MSEANQGAAADLAAGASGNQADPGQAQSVMVVPMSKSASLSADQVEKGFEMWKRLGLPAEDFIKAAAADGHKVVPYADPRSADEREYDKAFGGAEPDAYRLNWQGRMPEGMNQGDLVKLDPSSTLFRISACLGRATARV